MPDDLLRPSIDKGVDLSVRPWRLMSLAYVAFFGGVVATTVIAYLNAGRLGLGAAKRRLILVTGAVSLVLAAVVFAAISGEGVTSGVRVAVRVVAVVCCLVQLRLQRTMDRAFQLRGTEYGSLWGPGLAAVIGGGLVEAAILVMVGAAV